MSCTYRHKRTDKKYVKITTSFDVERQEHHVVYMSLDNGAIYNRKVETFQRNFELLCADVQDTIIPNDPNRK